jgi:ribosomal protein L29
MKKNEFKDMGRKEITAMIAESRGMLHDMKIKLSVGQMRDVREVRETRKRIARMEMQLATLKD